MVKLVHICTGTLCIKGKIMKIFSIYYQISGNSVSVTNLRLLSEETGIGKEKLKIVSSMITQIIQKFKQFILMAKSISVFKS